MKKKHLMLRCDKREKIQNVKKKEKIKTQKNSSLYTCWEFGKTKKLTKNDIMLFLSINVRLLQFANTLLFVLLCC